MRPNLPGLLDHALDTMLRFEAKYKKYKIYSEDVMRNNYDEDIVSEDDVYQWQFAIRTFKSNGGVFVG